MARQRKKKGRDISGWIILDKPAGMGSTQAVSKVKWLFNAQKAGHAGTLDPLASGMLPIALGDATKLEYAVHHFEIVERFGRFPHRNAALGRQSTPEELEYLAADDAAGFQKSQMPAQDAPGP